MMNRKLVTVRVMSPGTVMAMKRFSMDDVRTSSACAREREQKRESARALLLAQGVRRVRFYAEDDSSCRPSELLS